MKPYQFERIKTEINDVYAGNQSASKRYYLNSNSKSTERTKQIKKSNENVLQLINMWHEHRQSLSITPLMPADTQKHLTHNSVHALQDNLIEQINTTNNIKLTPKKNDQSDVYFSTSDHNYQIPICKPHLTLDNLIKQNISEIYNLLDPSNKVLQSQKENKRTISKSKQSDNKLKKTKEYLTTITLLSNAQKAVQQLYKNQDAAKAAEIDKKIQQVMFQIDKDFR
ncbi:unnamed protein product (macronuclear) [Paramecium tetraurelia]|uniref:Enkurin domain-containing protein n=1 Tax=Paramecium tetraurelia TaxID=5888 RepID=A0CJI7_PARTE|nr:uncharacterized protein GSPATT00000665001 [Paramecium tetraurelia]CAK70954.1 unnamed protein product [Paramecium tetraurelia]|eukprot:XP_001438351.1 hypothetical protein (macronuclear) [Paramecium tetraurelia strain d4-2]